MLKVVGASWLQTKISSYILAGVIILGIVSLFIGEIERIEDDGNYAATVYWTEQGGFRIEFWGQGNELAEVPRGVVRAYYRPDIPPTTGWSNLEIETNGEYPNWVQAFAAGIVEGALTWQIIHWQWQNTIESRCNKYPEECEKIREKLTNNMDLVRSRSIRNQDDPLWHQINLYYNQLEGLCDGWTYAVKKSRIDYEISLIDFVWMNSLTDVGIIEHLLNFTHGADPGSELPGLAAAFIRLVPDQPIEKGTAKEKVIVAHNTAGSYNTMLRIMKRYIFNYHLNLLPSSDFVPGITIEFAGYPAAISSQDDLYTISGSKKSKHHLTVAGTAINNFNPELWAKVNVDDHALIGPRVMAANRLAHDGVSWVRLIARVNSGTSPAQWVILNLSNLAFLNVTAIRSSSLPTPTPEHSLHRFTHTSIDSDLKSSNISVWRLLRRKYRINGGPGLLWTAEQLPGLTHAADQSNVLRAKGYWADYGIPHYQDMRDLTGIKKMETKYGDLYSLFKSPRAILFKNGFETATDLDSVTLLMRSNHYNKEVVNSDKFITPKPIEANDEIEPDDIVNDSEEVEQLIKNLEAVKTHVKSTDADSVSSILTVQEQNDITTQVDEILSQLSLVNSGESKEDKNESESESEEHLNLGSESEEEVEDKLVGEGSWHGLGARGDLHGWIGEKMYGLLPIGVVDTKAFSATSNGIDEFEATSGPAFSPALEKSIESLLKPSTRKKFGLSALLKKFRKSNLRFVSSSEESSSEEDEKEEPLDFEDALEFVVTKNIQIDPPKPYSVPPFRWSKSNFSNIPHVGQPDVWNFEPMKPVWVW